MHCAQHEADLDDYLDGELDAGRRAGFEAHAADCRHCAERLERARALARSLAAYPVQGPAPQFEARVLAGARVVQRPPRIVAAGFVAAFALSVLTLIYTGLMVGPPRRDAADPLPLVKMTLDERRTINLVFATDMPLDDVTLRIALPRGVELEGYEGQREVRWSTQLQEGKNLLPLELVATDTIGGRLTARLTHGGREKVFRIDLTVTDG